MTETERAVDDADDAERARGQGGGRPVDPLRRRWVRDEFGVLLVLELLIAGIGIPYPDFLDTNNLPVHRPQLRLHLADGVRDGLRAVDARGRSLGGRQLRDV
ncbi:hypothetical protein ACRAWF_42255 [Streptomyces sp. L7]